MGAAEDERINPRFDQRLQVLFDDAIRDRAFKPAFFDQRDEERAGADRDAEGGIERLDGAFVGAALDRSARPDHTDMAVVGRGDGGFRPGPDHANDRDRRARFQRREGEGRSGVAGNDDGLAIFLEQHGGDLEAITLDRRSTPAAVWDAGGVAQIMNRLVRQKRPQRAHHREAADAGVEDADWSFPGGDPGLAGIHLIRSLRGGASGRCRFGRHGRPCA